MTMQACSCCNVRKPLDVAHYTLQANGKYRKQCRVCKSNTNRRGRMPRLVVLPRTPPTPQVDPQLLVMVGAAMRMWKGPVNRESPMRWSVAA